MSELNGGDCYEIHGRAVLFDQKYAEAKLVHCIAILTRPPYKKFAHCYIEMNGMAIDFSNGNNAIIPIGLYQAVGRIDDSNCIRYTKEMVQEHILKTQHWGFWDNKFEAYL